MVVVVGSTVYGVRCNVSSNSGWHCAVIWVGEGSGSTITSVVVVDRLAGRPLPLVEVIGGDANGCALSVGCQSVFTC